MKKFVFATNNSNKISEIRRSIGKKYDFLSLKDIGCHIELPETSDTLQGNALQKARYVYQNFNQNCFSEDTGLEVNALNGDPGVYTARYAGENRNPIANMEKLLAELKNKSDRSARFRTVIALIIDGEEFLFEGIVNGQIAINLSGSSGFGYDPVFIPEGYEARFAQMSMEEKNKISHRGRAMAKLQAFLKGLVD